MIDYQNHKYRQKIEYFVKEFEDDLLFNYIVDENLAGELFSEDDVFIKSIDLKHKYNNTQAANLLGLTRSQRILNTLNSETIDYKSYIEPGRYEKGRYIHDSSSLFKLKMIFFLLDKGLSNNEIGGILGRVSPTNVTDNVVNMKQRNDHQGNIETRALVKEEVIKQMEPVFNIINELTTHVTSNNRSLKYSLKAEALTSEIKDSTTEISYLERELVKLKDETLSMRFSIQGYEKKYMGQPQQIEIKRGKAGLIKSLFGAGKDEVITIPNAEPDSMETDLYNLLIKSLKDKEEVMKNLNELLIQARTKKEQQELRLKDFLISVGVDDVKKLSLDNLLKEELIFENTIQESLSGFKQIASTSLSNLESESDKSYRNMNSNSLIIDIGDEE